MTRSVLNLALSEQQREGLSRVICAPTSTQREVRRARIVLLRATGTTRQATAQDVGIDRPSRLSRDKSFEANFWDVIGLHLNQPDRTLVLCCDEKSRLSRHERRRYLGKPRALFQANLRLTTQAR